MAELRIPSWWRHPTGRIVLAGLACGASGAIYVWHLRRKRRQEVKRAKWVSQSAGLDKRRFGLSPRGFVPEESEVLRRLPPEFDAWEKVADRLPELVLDPAALRSLVDEWPMLDYQTLLSSSVDDGGDFAPQIRRAYSVLSVVAHAYVWCDQDQPRAALPMSLAVPFHGAASCLGLPPVMTSSGLDLWNWVKTGQAGAGEGDQDAYRCINTITGTPDEEWFYCTSTAVQSLAGPLVVRAYDLLAEAVPNGDVVVIQAWLEECAVRLQAMASTLTRLAERCRAEVFWNKMRPFLQGFGGGATLTEGLVYAGVEEYGGRPQRFSGASAAQSSTIPVLDAMLGVEHRSNEAAFAKEMRQYMPKRHREYLELLQAQPSIRHVLLHWRDGGSMAGERVRAHEVSPLIPLFNECVERMADFRRAHWRLVGTHILVPKAADERAAASKNRGGCMGNPAEASAQGACPAARGTGGSPLEEFLQGTVSATLAARI